VLDAPRAGRRRAAGHLAGSTSRHATAATSRRSTSRRWPPRGLHVEAQDGGDGAPADVAPLATSRRVFTGLLTSRRKTAATQRLDVGRLDVAAVVRLDVGRGRAAR
jgi:hypothetical protein